MYKKFVFLLLIMTFLGLVFQFSLKNYQKVRLSLVFAPQSTAAEKIDGLKMLLRK